jgi:hypothetical protein
MPVSISVLVYARKPIFMINQLADAKLIVNTKEICDELPVAETE